VNEDNIHERREVSELKTFPVPFDSEKNQDIFSISIKTPTKLTKEELINKAIKFHSQGNIAGASKYYQYFIDQGFKDHRVFSNYGVILKGLGKLQDAEFLYRKAIEIKPDFADAHSNLGSILKDLGKLQDAELSYRKAIDIKPDFANALYNLGNILIELKQLTDAEIFIRKAIEIEPNFADAFSDLGSILLENGNLKEAEIATHEAIKINPNNAKYHYSLGGIFICLEKLKEAEIATRKAIAIKPNYAKGHIRLGDILFELGKIEESRISEWTAIKLLTSSDYLKSYRKNARSIKKTAFLTFGCPTLNHFLPVIEINPDSFEILVPYNINNNKVKKIRSSLKNIDIKIRSINEIIENNLIYEKLISHRGDEELESVIYKNNIKTKVKHPMIKILGKKNIRFMYTAGKNQYTISSYWNKYYDQILCYGPYHEDKFKTRHQVSTEQMGYPRFDKYFQPGFERDYLIKKFKCDPHKKTIVWLPTWLVLSSIDYYYKAISSLRLNHNIVVRPHPSMKSNDPENYKKLFSVDFNYIDEDGDDDNVQLYALADLMLFDYGGPMFGALYLNKNFAFLELDIESKYKARLGKLSSEDYIKSFFSDRIAKVENLDFICNYCLNNPPPIDIIKSLREEFFNTNYQGNSSKRAYQLLSSND